MRLEGGNGVGDAGWEPSGAVRCQVEGLNLRGRKVRVDVGV